MLHSPYLDDVHFDEGFIFCECTGGGFATGTIDLGGLLVKEVTTFNKTWATYEGGPDDAGATFFEPTGVPDGFFILGYYAQPNNRPLYGRVLVAKDGSNEAQPAVHSPIDYALVWSSNSLKVKEDAPGYIWAPIPRNGYAAVGLVVTTTPDKPPLKKVRCVRADLTTRCEPEEWIWGREAGQDVDEFNIFETRAGKKAKQVRLYTCIHLFTLQTCCNGTDRDRSVGAYR